VKDKVKSCPFVSILDKHYNPPPKNVYDLCSKVKVKEGLPSEGGLALDMSLVTTIGRKSNFLKEQMKAIIDINKGKQVIIHSALGARKALNKGPS